MSEEQNEEQKSGVGKKFALAGLAAAGAAAAYLLYGPDGDKNRAKLRGWMLKAKGEVMEELEKVEKLTKEKYEEVVNKVMDKYYDYAGVKHSAVDELKAKFMKYAEKIVETVDKKMEDVGDGLEDFEEMLDEKLDPGTGGGKAH